MSERKINLEEIYKSVIMTTNHGDFATISKDSIFKFAHEACKQLLELAAENAEVFNETPMQFYKLPKFELKVVKQSILDTIKQVE